MPKWSALALLAAALPLLCSCAPDEPLRVEAGGPRAELHGVLIPFESSEPLVRADFIDAGGDVVFSLAVPGLRSGELLVPSGRLGGEATLAVVSAGGGEARIGLRIPQESLPGLRIGAPFSGAGEEPVAVPASGEGFDLFLEIAGWFGEPLSYRVELTAGPGLRLTAVGEPQESGAGAERIVLEGGTKVYVRPLRRGLRIFAAGRGTGPARAELRAGGTLQAGGEAIAAVAVRELAVLPVEEIRAGLRIAKVEMPVTAAGGALSGLRADQLALAGSGGARVRAYQAVTVESALAVGAPVLVEAEIEGGGGGFGAPAYVTGGRARAAAVVPAGGTVRLVLPIYADPERVEPGRYQRRIALRLAGAGFAVDEKVLELEVERPAVTAMAVTAAAVAVTLLLLGYFLARGSRFLGRFTTRQIVLTALTASASVVMVNLPVFLITSITLVLLGPLGLLVDALFTGFLFNALLAALVAVVPRRGVCALVIAVRFLLGGLLLGMLTPLGALHAAVSALALEGAVWLSGAGRPGRAARGWLLPVMIGLANALISWVGFQLSIVLFRLYYADWYVALSVLAGGLLYSLIGAAAGGRVGARLAEAAA